MAEYELRGLQNIAVLMGMGKTAVFKLSGSILA
jgi:hypothetical protein